jgi:hypothetical protein
MVFFGSGLISVGLGTFALPLLGRRKGPEAAVVDEPGAETPIAESVFAETVTLKEKVREPERREPEAPQPFASVPPATTRPPTARRTAARPRRAEDPVKTYIALGVIFMAVLTLFLLLLQGDDKGQG